MNADSTALLTGILFNKKIYFPGIFCIYLARYIIDGVLQLPPKNI